MRTLRKFTKLAAVVMKLSKNLISLNLICTKLYRFRARVHCYYCLCIIFSANPVRRYAEELRGDPKTCAKGGNPHVAMS